MSQLPQDMLAKAATIARGLAIDAVHASQSGHLGLPLGCAEIGAVLFGYALRHNPATPSWLNRDRFVLSAGHGSMFLYSWLHLSGYKDFSLDEIKRFRQMGSKTPGHPELEHAPDGIETTTGPLGQGVANAVGMAVSAKMAEARFNTPEHTIFDHHIVVLAGDGCMQEGVAMEALEFAGHQQLDNLILIYDSNAVTLDAMAKETQSEDTAKRMEAIGFDVQTVEGQDMEVFLSAFERAKKAGSGKPQIIIAKTLIGKGIPEVEGTHKAHGESGAKFADAARKALGLPAEHYFVSPEVTSYFAEHRKKLEAEHQAWLKTFEAWKAKNPALVEQLTTSRAWGYTQPGGKTQAPDAAALLAAVPAFPADAKIATRKAGQDVLQPLAAKVPLLMGGSADLYGSTLNYIGDLKTGNDDFKPGHRAGRNIRFGIREHGMCSILNGIAQHGIFRPSGATFLVFADYCRAAIRLAALSHLPVTYMFTHDSVGVGEDGPTHQPVETVPGLRVIPNLDVIRPADPEETAGAFVAALERTGRTHAAGAHAPGRAAAERHPRADAARGRAQGRLHRPQGNRAPRPHPDVGRQRAAARARGRRAARAGHARGEPAVLRAVRPPAGRVPGRGAAAPVPAPRFHRGERHVQLGEVRGARRREPRHRPFRHVGSGQRGHGQAGHDGRERGRDGTQASELAAAGPHGLNGPAWKAVWVAGGIHAAQAAIA